MPHNLIDYLAETFKHNERWANAILRDRSTDIGRLRGNGTTVGIAHDTDIISILSKTITDELPKRLGGMKNGIIDP